MQKEKTSRKTLTQNVNIRTDARTDGWTDGRKDKNYIPLDILCMLGYHYSELKHKRNRKFDLFFQCKIKFYFILFNVTDCRNLPFVVEVWEDTN